MGKNLKMQGLSLGELALGKEGKSPGQSISSVMLTHRHSSRASASRMFSRQTLTPSQNDELIEVSNSGLLPHLLIKDN